MILCRIDNVMSNDFVDEFDKLLSIFKIEVINLIGRWG